MEKGRSPLLPISLNTYIGQTFNGQEEAMEMNVHDLDPSLLRCRTAQSMTMAPKRPYVEKHANLGRLSPESLIPLPPRRSTGSIASNYSNTDSNSNSGKSRASRSSCNSSKTRSSSASRCNSTPSSSFSAFVMPASPCTPSPCLKFAKYNLAQMEEDVLVMDAVALDNTNTSSSSFIAPKPKFSSHTALFSGTPSNDIVADGRYRFRHQLGSAQNQLRSSHALHRSYKSQIVPADNEEVWPALSRSKAKMTQGEENIWPLPVASSTNKEEIGCADYDLWPSVTESNCRVQGHSLAIPKSKTGNKIATIADASRECGLQSWNTCRRFSTETRTTGTTTSKDEKGTSAPCADNLEIWQSQAVEALFQELQLRPSIPRRRRLPVFEEISPSEH